MVPIHKETIDVLRETSKSKKKIYIWGNVLNLTALNRPRCGTFTAITCGQV